MKVGFNRSTKKLKLFEIFLNHKACLEKSRIASIFFVAGFLAWWALIDVLYPNAAGILHVLESMLSHHKNSGKTINWDHDTDLAIGTIKEKLASITKLAFRLMGAQIQLVTVGSATSHWWRGKTDRIFFKGTKLGFWQQLLAIHLSIRHFKYFLEGRPFSLITDHKSLIYAFVSSMKNATARQMRQVNFISEFSTNVHYLEGAKSVVADCCLNRTTDENVLFEKFRPLNFRAISDKETVDSEICNLMKSNTHSLQWSYV